ncbi:hypothetical protein FIBSPDRAFT_874056, partial [Athelia psychrophila]
MVSKKWELEQQRRQRLSKADDEEEREISNVMAGAIFLKRPESFRNGSLGRLRRKESGNEARKDLANLDEARGSAPTTRMRMDGSGPQTRFPSKPHGMLSLIHLLIGFSSELVL